MSKKYTAKWEGEKRFNNHKTQQSGKQYDNKITSERNKMDR